MSPKITKARGATSADDGSNLLAEKVAEADGVEKTGVEVPEGETGELVGKPAKSATRAEWNAFAESVGVEDPASLANKDAVIAAVDKSES
jgi:hypothetical protein